MDSNESERERERVNKPELNANFSGFFSLNVFACQWDGRGFGPSLCVCVCHTIELNLKGPLISDDDDDDDILLGPFRASIGSSLVT